jgi:hypothetical protein
MFLGLVEAAVARANPQGTLHNVPRETVAAGKSVRELAVSGD